MSISNLFIPNQYNLLCNDFSCNGLTADDITSTIVTSDGIQFSSPPPINNTLNDLLAVDSIGDIVIRQASSIPGTGTQTINNAPGVTVPIKADLASTPSDIILNGLAVNGAQGFVLIPAPPLTGGDIVINNSFLNQSVTTTSSPLFNSLTSGLTHIGGLYIDNPPLIAGATDNNCLIIPASGQIQQKTMVSLNDAQTITNKTINSSSNILNIDSLLISAYYNLENSQPISNNTDSVIIYDTTNVTSPSISYNSGTGIFTINKVGVFTFNATTAFTANITGTRGVYFTHNGDTLHYSNMYISAASSTINTQINNTFTNKFIIGDTISVVAFQNSGIGLQIEGNDDDVSSFTSIMITGVTKN